MQLYAQDVQGHLCSARHSHKRIDYFCLECQRLVRLRGGPMRQPHFYHLDPTPDCRQHQKGIIHLQLQAYCLNLLPQGDCKIEFAFPQVRRIADVAWMSQKIVFEIQYSPISAEEALQRNRDYALCGWQVIWILHDYRYNQVRPSHVEIALRSSPHYFSNMDQFGKGMIYDQYDRIENGIRSRRLPALPVDITQIFDFKEKNNFKTSIKSASIEYRANHWPYFFHGDLSYLYYNNQIDERYHALMFRHEMEIAKEEKLSLLNTWSSWMSFILARTLSLYNMFFHFVLERACRKH